MEIFYIEVLLLFQFLLYVLIGGRPTNGHVVSAIGFLVFSLVYTAWWWYVERSLPGQDELLVNAVIGFGLSTTAHIALFLAKRIVKKPIFTIMLAMMIAHVLVIWILIVFLAAAIQCGSIH